MSKKIKKASNFVFWLGTKMSRPFLWRKYRFRFQRSTSKHIRRPCLILSNHQTAFDQFVVGTSFPFGINFVAGNSIFRHGFISWLMTTLLRPIAYNKGSSDSAAIKEMLSVIRQKGVVCIFPSGNRSFFGEECTARPGIGKLAKKMNVPLVFVQMRGGYNTKPRWSAKPRKGKMTASVIREISVEELSTLTADELEEIIRTTIYFNEFEWNAKEKIAYRSKRKAEYLESVLFYCPECQTLDKLSSKGNDFFCTHCGMSVSVNDYGFFEKVQHSEHCPDTILEWSRQQLEAIKSIDYTQYIDKPLFSDDNVKLSEATRKKQQFLGKGSIALYGDRLTVCGREIPIAGLTDMSIQDKARLSIYTSAGELVVDMPTRGNAVKYMVCGYHLKNQAQRIENGHYGY